MLHKKNGSCFFSVNRLYCIFIQWFMFFNVCPSYLKASMVDTSPTRSPTQLARCDTRHHAQPRPNRKNSLVFRNNQLIYAKYPIIYMVLYILLHYNIGGFRKKDFFHPSVIPTFLWSLVESSQSIFPRPQIGWFFMEIQKPQTWNCSWWLHGYEWISMHISELVNLTDKKCCILGTWKNPVKSSLRFTLRLSSHVVLIFREGMDTFDISTMSIMIQTGITRWYWQLIRSWWFLSATKKCRHIWTCLLEVPCSDAVWLSSTSFSLHEVIPSSDPSWADPKLRKKLIEKNRSIFFQRGINICNKHGQAKMT